MGLSAWLVLAADASDRARFGVDAFIVLSVPFQFGLHQCLAGRLLQVALVIGWLMYRRTHATDA